MRLSNQLLSIWWLFTMQTYNVLSGVVVRIHAFWPGGPSSIPVNYNFFYWLSIYLLLPHDTCNIFSSNNYTIKLFCHKNGILRLSNQLLCTWLLLVSVRYKFLLGLVARREVLQSTESGLIPDNDILVLCSIYILPQNVKLRPTIHQQFGVIQHNTKYIFEKMTIC